MQHFQFICDHIVSSSWKDAGKKKNLKIKYSKIYTSTYDKRFCHHYIKYHSKVQRAHLLLYFNIMLCVLIYLPPGKLKLYCADLYKIRCEKLALYILVVMEDAKTAF